MWKVFKKVGRVCCRVFVVSLCCLCTVESFILFKYYQSLNRARANSINIITTIEQCERATDSVSGRLESVQIGIGSVSDGITGIVETIDSIEESMQSSLNITRDLRREMYTIKETAIDIRDYNSSPMWTTTFINSWEYCKAMSQKLKTKMATFL